MTEKITNNKYVEFTYSITNEENQIIEQVEVPVNYVHGAKMGLWPKLEDALENKEVNDKINVTFEPGEVFGEVDKDLIFNGINIIDLVIKTNLASSKSEIRRIINNKGLKINNQVILNDQVLITNDNLDENKNIKVSHGKKQHVIIKAS